MTKCQLFLCEICKIIKNNINVIRARAKEKNGWSFSFEYKFDLILTKEKNRNFYCGFVIVCLA